MQRNTKILIAVIAVAFILIAAGPMIQLITTAREQARLDKLLPEVRDAVQALRQDLADRDIRTFVDQTLRTDAQQHAEVLEGDSTTDNSWHEVGRAVDLYPMVDGKPDWNGTRIDLYKTMHDLAALRGFRGLAFNNDGTRRYIHTKKGAVWDGGHLEYRGGLTYAQAYTDYRNRVDV